MARDKASTPEETRRLRQEKPTAEKPTAEKPASEKPGAEKPASEKPRPDGPTDATGSASSRVRPDDETLRSPTLPLTSDHGLAESSITTRPGLEPLVPGMSFAHYELIRELGRGGMGAVYLARDIRLGRRVAVKFLHSQNEVTAARFVAEAKVTARCKHPHIVELYDVGKAHGYSYMVLEYLEGVTLRKWMRARWDGSENAMVPAAVSGVYEARTDSHASSPVSPVLAVELMIPVVRGLERAHGLGLVHRDLKPENIMLSDDGAIKVLDFGIATVFTSGSLADTAGHHFGKAWAERGFITGHGGIIGTLPYMSPEQSRAEAVDQRTDIWAVGIMLWELCTGQHPLAPLSKATLKQLRALDVSMPSMADEHPALGPLGAVVDRCLAKDPDQRFDSARALLDALEPLLPGRRGWSGNDDGDESPDNPYVGLAAFQESDAARFFGRDQDISSMLTRIRNHRLVTVAGASGAGKSSFVRAGVIPALARSGQKWQWFIARPGRQPLGALANVLEQLSRNASESAPIELPAADDRNELIRSLREERGFLGAMLRAYCRRRYTRVLLFVDQFEELYTLGADRDTREAFVRCLEGVADDESSPLRVVLSVRSDFLDRVAEDRAFTSEITRALVLLPSMGREQLGQALTRPLEAVGYQFECHEPNRDRLVGAMLDVLEGTRAPLPLLQFTAARLWDVRDTEAKCITQQSYDKIGGVEGALSAHADTVLGGLSVSDQRLARTVLTSLVTPERTRAIVSVSELRALAGEPDATDAVLQVLADARLLVIETDVAAEDDSRSGMDDPGEHGTVEIVHESLIHRWSTLRRWLDEGADDAEFLARLRSASKAWNKRGKAEGMLWAGEVAREAKSWYERYQKELPTREIGFLEAVFAKSERSAWRKRMLVYGTMVALAVVAVSATVGVLVVLQKQRAAEKSEARAEQSGALAKKQALAARKAVRIAGAKGLVERDPNAALQLLREVEAPDPSNDILDWNATVQASVSKSLSFDRDWLRDHKGSVNSVAFSRDGTRVVTASEDNTARVWTLRPLGPTDGTWTAHALEGHEDGVNWAVFSPDGTQVLTASKDKTARVWTLDPANGNSWTVEVLEGHEDGVRSAVFSPDGTRVVTVSWDQTARMWTRGPERTWTARALGGHSGGVRSADFSPDGTRVVTTASWDATVRVWAQEQGRDHTWTAQILEGHEGTVYSGRFSPDGTRLVTASADQTARVWTSSQGTWSTHVLEGHAGPVYSAAFSPRGTRVVTASADKTARVWNWQSGQWTARSLEGHEAAVHSAVFSSDGAQVVTASDDKTARVWTLGDDRWTARSLEGHADRVNSAVFSPDGMRVITASREGRAHVWFLANEDLVPRLWRAVPDCLSVEKRRALLGETPETARLNREVCLACVAYYQDPDAQFPCRDRPDADLADADRVALASLAPPTFTPETRGPGPGSGPTSETRVIVPTTVPIPGGSFLMGSPDTEEGRDPDEGPMREVQISPFSMCKTEITQAQWASIMEENAEPSNCVYGCSDRHPVRNVHWFDVIEYLNRLSASQGLEACYEHDGGYIRWKPGFCDGYRLPSEAEWAYAARAGTTTAYSFGDDVAELKDYAWYTANAGGKAHEVGSKRPNAWSLYDMHGNTWEWVWDRFVEPYPAHSQRDPRGPDTGDKRVVRGGSFEHPTRYVRSAFRHRFGPSTRHGQVGFRCARSRPPQE